MSQENGINLEIALKKIHELALPDGDLGYAYWHQIGQLLKHTQRLMLSAKNLSDVALGAAAKRNSSVVNCC